MLRRDVQKLKKERDRARHQARLSMMEKQAEPGPTQERRMTLRPVLDAGAVREVDTQALRHGGRPHPAPASWWVPEAGCVVQVAVWPGEGRKVIGVHADVIQAMMRWVTPRLVEATGAVLVGRGRDDGGPPSGGSVILSMEDSSSGAHYDKSDTLLTVVSGEREVWVAPPDAVTEALLKRYNGGGGSGPTFLPSSCDPTHHTREQCALDGVRWWPPVQLQAGDAIWIKEGWWHCVGSKAGDVAIPIEIVSRCIEGVSPCVYRRAASCHREGAAVSASCLVWRVGARRIASWSCGALLLRHSSSWRS